MGTPARQLSLQRVPGRFRVLKLPLGADPPPWLAGSSFVSFTRTPGEVSVVCEAHCVPRDAGDEDCWEMLRVAGRLGFGETGVLASLAGPLAEARISVFALSTHDTDYLLVPAAALDAACGVLAAAGHTFP